MILLKLLKKIINSCVNLHNIRFNNNITELENEHIINNDDLGVFDHIHDINNDRIRTVNLQLTPSRKL